MKLILIEPKTNKRFFIDNDSAIIVNVCILNNCFVLHLAACPSNHSVLEIVKTTFAQNNIFVEIAEYSEQFILTDESYLYLKLIFVDGMEFEVSS